MKKYLITFDTEIIRNAPEMRDKWGVDSIIDDPLKKADQLFEDPEVMLFIPVITDSINGFSYGGADISLRLFFRYLQKFNPEKAPRINIVLMGIESEKDFMKHYPYPNILKIPGFSYCLFNAGIVANSNYLNPRIESNREYLPYLKQLGITKPSSFKSAHSLTNEWCVYKWNTFMGYTDDSVKETLQSLYFDYLMTMERLSDIKEKRLSNNQVLQKDIESLKKRGATILLIDDNTHWHTFFHNFFLHSQINFEAIGENFKRQSFEEIQKNIEEKINACSPDVILLDFRLMEDKDANCGFNQISGTKVLKHLKGSFDLPGSAYARQFMIFTATGRIENILRLKELNADGFIIKEKPEQYASKKITKDLISSMVEDISQAIDRANFLIPLNEKLDTLETLRHATDEVYNENIRGAIEKVRSTLETVIKSIRLVSQISVPTSQDLCTTNRSIKLDFMENHVDYSLSILKLIYLNLFSILEATKFGKEGINSHIQDTSPNSLLNIWNNIVNLRNALAHGSNKISQPYKKRAEQTITSELLKKYILVLCEFIEAYLIHSDIIIDLPK